MTEVRQAEANTAAQVHAMGWSCFMNRFRGDGDALVDWTDLMPFPDRLAEAVPRKLSPQTAAALRGSLVYGKFSEYLLQELAPFIEDAKRQR